MEDKSIITVKREYGHENFYLPNLPNYIRRVDDNFPVDIGELSEPMLKNIAGKWAADLVMKAKQRRKNLS